MSMKYSLNKNYFQEINSPEKAYWLGFIFADGFVHRTGNSFVLTLQEKDRNHLIKFKKAIEFTGNIKESGKGGFEGSTKRCTLSFSDKTFSENLRSRGIYPGRSEKSTSLPLVPKQFFSDVFRGYFDGNGSVYTQRNTSWHKGKLYEYFPIVISIIGREELLLSMIEETGFEKRRLKASKNNNLKYLELYGKKEMPEIYKFLYEDASVYLDRKFNKFTSLLRPLSE